MFKLNTKWFISTVAVDLLVAQEMFIMGSCQLLSRVARGQLALPDQGARFAWGGVNPNYNCRQVAQMPQPVLSPTRLETNWKKCRVLGQGANGQVFLAVHKSTGKEGAVKQIRKDNGAMEKQGRREFERLKQIGSSDHIVKLADQVLYADDSNLYYVLEYCGSESLQQYTERVGGRLREEDSRSVLRQILLAIRHLQTRGIVHRDIKPENIMVMKDASTLTIKLIDFDLSALLMESAPVVAGTPGYISPDLLSPAQRGRGTAQPLVSSDAWSAAVVYCELLFGRQEVMRCQHAYPWDAMKGDEKCRAFFSLVWGNLCRIVPTIQDSHMRGLIMGMLQENTSFRWSIEKCVDFLNQQMISRRTTCFQRASISILPRSSINA